MKVTILVVACWLGVSSGSMFPACSPEGARYPDPSSCRYYLECVKSKMVSKSCGPLFDYDVTSKSCKFSLSATCGQVQCPETQLTATPRTAEKKCQGYVQCKDGKRVSQTCYLDRNFDPVTGECSFGYNCDKTPECLPNERKPVERDCVKYLECSSEGKFVEKSCYLGWSFNKKTLECEYFNHCPECSGWDYRPDEKDEYCQRYEQCLRGKVHQDSCWWFHRFDPGQKSCRWRWYVACHPKAKRQVMTLAKDDKTCTADKPIEGNCREYLQCKDGKYVKAKCRLCKNFSPDTMKCTWPWKYPCDSPTPTPKCQKEKEIEEIDCKNYRQCEGGLWVDKSCGWFKVFRKDTQDCRFSWWPFCKK